MIQKLRSFAPTSREKGFSLMEMLIVVLILGILATVAIFLYQGAQKNADEAAIKTGLLQAASLIEQEKTDLDGMYPKYLPNEVVQNELWSKFAYTYSDDRLFYCLAARQPDQTDPTNPDKDTLWYVSSASKEASHDDCTQNNIGTNSVLPWGNIIPPQAKPTSFVMSWPVGATSAKADLTWPSNICASGATISYDIKLTDTDENKVFEDPAATGTNISYSSLPGFLPDDNVQAQIKTTCTKTFAGQDYPTSSQFTDPVTAVIPALPVPDSSFVVNPSAFLCKGTEAGDNSTICALNTADASSFTMYATGSVAQVTCPVGVNKFQIIASQGGKALQASNLSTTQSQTWQLANFNPDTATTYTGISACVVTRRVGTSVQKTIYTPTDRGGQVATWNEYSPVGWPAAVTGLGTTSAYSGTGTTPNGLVWDPTSCTFGGTPVYQYVQSSPASPVLKSSYQSTTGAGPIAWQQATIYGYYMVDKCVTSHNNGGTAVQSKEIAGNVYQFATDVSVPTPTFNVTPAAYYKSGTSMYVAGSVNPITCVNNSTAAYSLTAVQSSTGKTTSSVMNASPSFDLSLAGFSPDTSTTYYAYAYCLVKQPNNQADKPYTSAPVYTTEYTPLAAPGASTTTLSVNGNPDVIYNQLNASTVTCPTGGTLQYRFIMTSPSNGTSSWSAGTTFNGTFSGNNVNMNGLTNGTSYSVATQTYCRGTNVNSPTTTGATNTYTASYNAPNTPSQPGSVSVSTTDPTQTQTVSWSSVSCDRGGTAQYYLVQNYHNDNNDGTGSSRNSGWTTATSFNASGWIDWQGAYYQYAVQARCVNNNSPKDTNGNYDSSKITASSWTYSNGFTEGIKTPSAVGNIRNNNYTTVSWDAVSCPSGTYATYLVDQNETNGSWYDNYLYNRTTATSVGVNGSGAQQQNVAVQAYCQHNSNVSAGSNWANTQWTVWQNPTLNSYSLGGCWWPDVFYYNVCQSSYNSGYPGISGSDVSPNYIGLGFNTSGQLYGTPAYAAPYTVSGILYNASGNSGWQQLINTTFQEYNQAYHGASDNWAQGGDTNTYGYQLSYAPCTLGASGCSSAYSAAYSGQRGSGSIKLDTQKTTVATSKTQCRGTSVYGICGQTTFAMKGLIAGHTYAASCYVFAGVGVGNGSARAGITGFGMNVSGDTYNVISAQDETWQLISHQFTPSSGNATLAVFAGNGDSNSEHEWEISGCQINY